MTLSASTHHMNVRLQPARRPSGDGRHRNGALAREASSSTRVSSSARPAPDRSSNARTAEPGARSRLLPVTAPRSACHKSGPRPVLATSGSMQSRQPYWRYEDAKDDVRCYTRSCCCSRFHSCTRVSQRARRQRGQGHATPDERPGGRPGQGNHGVHGGIHAGKRRPDPHAQCASPGLRARRRDRDAGQRRTAGHCSNRVRPSTKARRTCTSSAGTRARRSPRSSWCSSSRKRARRFSSPCSDG